MQYHKILAFAAAVGMVTAVRGAIVQTNSEVSGTEIGIPVSATDLVNQGQATLNTATSANFSPFSDGSGNSSPTILNNGTAGTSQKSVETAVTTQKTNWTLVYNLNTTTNTQGYRLTEIDTFSGWTTDFVNQRYTLAYATTGAPTTFIDLGTFALNSTTAAGVQDSLKIALTDSTGAIATNVAALQFTFIPGAASTNHGAYREIDVIGTAVPLPEPASVGLLGVGALALFSRRRRV